MSTDALKDGEVFSQVKIYATCTRDMTKEIGINKTKEKRTKYNTTTKKMQFLHERHCE